MWFLRQGQRAVEALGRDFAVPVERCFQTNPNVRQIETREINVGFRGYRVRVGGARSRVACWLQGFMTTVRFALNRRERIMFLDQPMAVPGAEGLAVFTSRLEPPPPVLHEWLGSPDNVRALRDLELSRKESLQVYANAVVLVGEPHRATRQTLSQLADLADRLPRETAPPAEPAAAGRPQLVQFADLKPAHFAAHPVWIQCHVVDYDEPWYDETDEETFRPWRGALPAGPDAGTLLVAADLTLADGTEFMGFVTPASREDAGNPGLMGTLQPHLFLPGGRCERFWDGGVRRSAEDRARLYAELRRTPDQVFPIRFAARDGLTAGFASGQIAGFYAISGLGASPSVSR